MKLERISKGESIMKRKIILFTFLLSILGFNGSTTALASEQGNLLEVVDSNEATMSNALTRSSISVKGNLSKSNLVFVATSTASQKQDSIWSKCESYTSGKKLINSDQNTVKNSKYGSAQATFGILHTSPKSLGYHQFKKSGYNTVTLTTKYNW